MDFGCETPDLSRARLDAEIMRENLLVVKNSLLDQAGLIKVLESKDARNKLIEFENQQLSSELKRLTQREDSIPHVIDSLNTKIEELQCKLKSQELINEQLQTRTDFSKERNRWLLEEEKYKRAISKKEKENVELKAALNEAGDQVRNMKLQIKHSEMQNSAKFEEMKRIIEGLKSSLVVKEKELFTANFSLEKGEKQIFELELEKNSLLKAQSLKESENNELRSTIKEQEQLFKDQKEKIKEDFECKIKDIKNHMNDQIVTLKVSFDQISKENSDLNKILDICNFEKCKFEKLVFDLQNKINEAKNGSHILETHKKAANKPLLALQAQSSITVSCLVLKKIEEAALLAPAARNPLKSQRKIDGIEKLVPNSTGLPLKRQRPQRTSLQNEAKEILKTRLIIKESLM
ncbi:unnamed protein product [Blepharisma stoltei]|uniref:Uncharacterized protein n=1 Tax=Blepharisma stoltei TaxID=1481888 RepID=A0AAU9JCI2_9CILI|nr:unnamed protein product [Blepharisma stoltei]